MKNRENKTKESQIRASVNYDIKKGNIVIGCKVTKEYKTEIENHYNNKGFKSMNEYILSLIDNDIHQ